jgi:dienelactone hydrolase
MSFADQKALFDYDASLPFEVQTNHVDVRDGVTIKDITFTAIQENQPVRAYLVAPENADSCAAILWVHWLGEEHCNRNQYLDEATAIAKAGVVSLLPDAMWSQEDWYPKRVPAADYANSIRQVIELRRAMDLLLSQPHVDPTRVAFVGHDYGGMYGTLASGVDNKAKAYVLIAVAPSFFDWAFYAAQPESRADYICQNAVLEPTDYLRQIKNASFLFQYAETDPYIGYMKRVEFVRSAPEPREMKVYADAEHSMNTAQIRADRSAWLKTQLGLG